ncbi:MAG: hypothetical protein JWM74_2186 [Myxococcaceae bacterium]|nr:hypothetical protein [Myxococcaceae bacterium]
MFVWGEGLDVERPRGDDSNVTDANASLAFKEDLVKKSLLVLVAALASLAAACGKTAPADTTSSVTGALDVGSFSSKPTFVEAIDEKGVKTQASVDASGKFTLSLPKGHTYHLAVALAAGSEPVVFPRASKRLDTTMHVSTGAATVALGSIRHLASAPAEIEGNDDAQTCENGNDQQGDNQTEDNGADGETNDDGPETDADPSQPMAVPEHNAPDDVGGCNEENDGETNDD